ncbi:MAG TPA: AMP-binding protein, partial [Alphaproteobacteria bacterium]|nr:AMP-binding protein [Alphaproteobacteria bacterium]
IVKDCDAAYVMTTRQTLQRIQPLIQDEPQFQLLRWVVTDDLPLALAGAWRNQDVPGDAIAFLQYTSGSTAAPKGVVVSHSNLLHNEFAIQQAFRQSESSIIVGWLPLYHDMGLIGNMLQPVYAGARCILMSPVAFLQRPARWLSAISRYHGTTSGGPNFSYDLCARKVTEEEKAGLDLSSWNVAFNGAEPVRPDTMERFVARFGHAGFSAKAFAPCYGLAESTLLVTADAGETLPRTLEVDVDELAQHRVAEANHPENAKPIAGCGRESAFTRIAIVDPESLTPCAPHCVGEIWIAGPCVAGGYWNNKAESERVFYARIQGSGEGPFLRTGDLGFLRNGELFVMGRSKDMVIIRGRNYYPQDIELTVESSHPGLKLGCGAAFAIEATGQEQLVIVQEVDHGCEEKAREAVDAICTALADQHEIQPHAVVLIQTGSIPKTSSGKIQRYACREQFLKRTLTALLEWRAGGGPAEPSAPEAVPQLPATPLELGLWLAKQIASVTGVSPAAIQPEHSMIRYAVDSLAAVSLSHTIEKQLGVTISLPDVLGKSVREFV